MDKISFWYRNGVPVTVVTVGDQTYKGYVGFHPTSSLYGSIFVTLCNGKYALYRSIPGFFSQETMDNLWWMTFDASFNYEKTEKELYAIVDNLQNVDT